MCVIVGVCIFGGVKECGENISFDSITCTVIFFILLKSLHVETFRILSIPVAINYSVLILIEKFWE